MADLLYIGNLKSIKYHASNSGNVIASIESAKAECPDSYAFNPFSIEFDSEDFSDVNDIQYPDRARGTVKTQLIDTFNNGNHTNYLYMAVTRVGSSADCWRMFNIYVTDAEGNTPSVYDMYQAHNASDTTLYTRDDLTFYNNINNRFICSAYTTGIDSNLLFESNTITKNPDFKCYFFLIQEYRPLQTSEPSFNISYTIRTYNPINKKTGEEDNYIKEDSKMILKGYESGIEVGTEIHNSYVGPNYILESFVTNQIVASYTPQQQTPVGDENFAFWNGSILSENGSGGYIPSLPGEGSDKGGNIPNQNDFPNGRGGDGTKDWGGDSEGIMTPPQRGSVAANFTNIYIPEISIDRNDLENLKAFLWGTSEESEAFWNLIKRVYNDPVNSIISFHSIPVSLPSASYVANQPLYIGGISTGVYTNKWRDSEFVVVDFGTITFDKGEYNSFLDYEPYSSCQIYLPFVGVQAINLIDIWHTTIHLVMNYNIITGDVCYQLEAKNGNTSNAASCIKYEWRGNCIYNIEITGRNMGQAFQGTLTAASGVAQMFSGALSLNAGAVVSGASNVVNGYAQSAYPSVERAGSFSPSSGYMGSRTAKLIFTSPKTQYIEGFSKNKGKVSFYNKTISEMKGKGYTELQYQRLEGISLSEEEIEELQQILKDGVYL